MKIGSVTCQVLADMQKEKKSKVDCGGDKEKLVGRKVRVEHWATHIQLCEVQVFGESATASSLGILPLNFLFNVKKLKLLNSDFCPSISIMPLSPFDEGSSHRFN